MTTGRIVRTVLLAGMVATTATSVLAQVDGLALQGERTNDAVRTLRDFGYQVSGNGAVRGIMND